MLRKLLFGLIVFAGAATAVARVEDGVLLLIDDPLLLARLEEKGFSAPERIEGEKLAAADLRSWARRPYYDSIRQRLVEDLREVKAGDRALGVTMASGHRLFNGEWLASPDARFELVGVVNRIDRASFYAATAAGACGEVRFIYRLSYARRLPAETVYTRLPVTLNVVYWAPGPDCQATARAWLRAREPGAADLEELLAGPLKPALFPLARLKSVEVNLQSVRWPSTIRPDLGGHAEYILRVFHRAARRFEPAGLENTPDLARPALAAELKAHLRRDEVRRGFDEGTAVLPEKFLAKRATSVAFYGQSRQANRPFEKFVSEKDLRDLIYGGARFVKSPAGYVRRLNEMSCMGCHQGRSIAGFHFVGIDAPGTHPANAIKVSHSAHLLRDLPRRAAFVKAVAAGTGADPARPFAERAVWPLPASGGDGDSAAAPGPGGTIGPSSPAEGAARVGTDGPPTPRSGAGTDGPPARGVAATGSRPAVLLGASAGVRSAVAAEGGYGDHCGLGSDPTFKDWGCEKGLECRLESGPVGGAPVGVCLPPRGKPELARAGDPCDPGKMTQNFNAHRDRLVDKKIENCGEGRGCFAAGEGFPGGLCFGDCDSLQSGEACGLIAVYGFNECLFQGKLFTDCLKNHTGPISLRACDENTPCRDDYICTGASGPGPGTCIPPYFLFQLRLDGHVKPR